MEYLSLAARFGELSGPAKAPSRDAIEVDVFVRVWEDENRTYILDGLFFYPFLGTLPLTPLWGHANVEATLSFRAPETLGPESRPVEPPDLRQGARALQHHLLLVLSDRPHRGRLPTGPRRGVSSARRGPRRAPAVDEASRRARRRAPRSARQRAAPRGGARAHELDVDRSDRRRRDARRRFY
jgi:hypothetical protein